MIPNLGCTGRESHIHPRKPYLSWQNGSLLSEVSLQEHLKEPVGWLGLGISSEPGQAFWLFLASAIVCASGGVNAGYIFR